MKKSMLICFIALLAVTGLALPVAAADGVIAPQLSTMDLSAMPLVSRSLAEFDSDRLTEESASAVSDAENYPQKTGGPGWLFASLIEPFYLSLLGAALLVLGTVRGRRDV